MLSSINDEYRNNNNNNNRIQNVTVNVSKITKHKALLHIAKTKTKTQNQILLSFSVSRSYIKIKKATEIKESKVAGNVAKALRLAEQVGACRLATPSPA